MEELVRERTVQIENRNAELITEIAARQKLEEALIANQKKLQETYTSMIEGLVLHDMVYDDTGKAVDYRITEVNPAFEKITGLKAADVVGKKASVAYGTEEALYLDIYAQVASTSEPASFEVYFPPMKKHLAISVFSPGKGKFATVLQDITERKQVEEEIRALNEHLKQHEAELSASNKELEAFSYSVSHDLRAPLRNIDGFSQALLEDYASKLDEKGKDYLNRVRSATQRMGGLIDDLLSLSVTMRREMRRENVDLSTLAYSVLKDLKDTEPERLTEIIIQEKMFVRGDASLLREMLVNLLGNAWKFTSKRIPAQIEFGSTEKSGETIFFIKDNGAGFDIKYVDKLFIPFQRLHSTTEFAGNGIGLANVKRIIERHGGTIWAEGISEKGATFYFKLG